MLTSTRQNEAANWNAHMHIAIRHSNSPIANVRWKMRHTSIDGQTSTKCVQILYDQLANQPIVQYYYFDEKKNHFWMKNENWNHSQKNKQQLIQLNCSDRVESCFAFSVRFSVGI